MKELAKKERKTREIVLKNIWLKMGKWSFKMDYCPFGYGWNGMNEEKGIGHQKKQQNLDRMPQWRHYGGGIYGRMRKLEEIEVG